MIFRFVKILNEFDEYQKWASLTKRFHFTLKKILNSFFDNLLFIFSQLINLIYQMQGEVWNFLRLHEMLHSN